MDEIRITFGNSGDIQAITRFQVDMAMESEGTALDLDKVLQGVTHAMEDDSKGRYVVAYDGEKAIGSLMLTKEWSDWHDAWYWWIQSVYVMPGYRGKGVYKAMYQTVMDAAKAENISEVRLYVDKSNTRAQTAYQKLGMQESHYLMYEVEIQK